MNSQNLKIANTFFQKRQSRRWTWRSADGRTMNEIDHLLIDNLNIVTDVGVISTFDFSSDHRPVRCKIKIKSTHKTKSKNRNEYLMTRKIPVHKRKEAEVLLGSLLEPVEWEETDSYNLQERYDIFAGTVKKILEELDTPKNEIKTDELSKETKKLISRRTAIRQKITLTRDKQSELIPIKNVIKKKIKEDVYNYEQEIAKSILESTWPTRQTRKALSKGKYLLPRIKNEVGQKFANREKIVEIATRFYQNIYTDRRATTIDTNDSKEWQSHLINHDEFSPITSCVVKNVLAKLKPNRAPGTDGVENETLKLFKDKIAEPLAALFNCILFSGFILKQWYLSEIILLHKKGDKNRHKQLSPNQLII